MNDHQRAALTRFLLSQYPPDPDFPRYSGAGGVGTHPIGMAPGRPYTSEHIAQEFAAFAARELIGYAEKHAVQAVVAAVLGPGFGFVADGIMVVIHHEYPLGMPVSRGQIQAGVFAAGILVLLGLLRARGTS